MEDTTRSERLPRLELRRLLGAGSMGEVHAAWDRELGREVAYKQVHGLDPRDTTRLKHEFRRAADLVHPNLVQLYELISDGDRLGFTMEIVDGLPFVEALRVGVAPGQALPADRLSALADAVEQLADGLTTLHEAQVVHRDIKPSNVLITAQGRVAVLDFGIALPLGEPGPLDQEGAGTLAYMPPEAFHDTWSPAGDAYAVGVMLFEVLTGALPFSIEPQALIACKLGAAPHRSCRGHGLPEALVSLVDALLDASPERRPPLSSAADTLSAWRRSPTVRTSHAVHAPFVGRAEELAALETTLTEAGRGQLRLITISGQSGHGKSELVRRFLQRLDPARHVLLSARCHPYESMPYKALDGAIDRLALHLITHEPGWRDAMSPAEVDALEAAFPALRVRPGPARPLVTFVDGVDLFATLNPGPQPASSWQGGTLRELAFVALGRLLRRVARQQPVVLFIDDLQWGDTDSADLLAHLLRRCRTSALMVIISWRAEDADAASALLGPQLMRDLEGHHRHLTLTPLDTTSLEEIARRTGGEDARGLIAECQGSPLFLLELLRSASAPGAGQPRRLEEVLQARITRLSQPERDLLIGASIAADALPVATLLSLAGLSPADRPTLHPLRAGSLVRLTGGPNGPAVTPFHDRVAEAALQALAPPERRSWHARLADLLVGAPDPDPDAVLRHMDAAGRAAEAATWAHHAVRRARDTMAWHRAASLLRLMLQRGWGADEAGIGEDLGDALANAGLGEQAGEAHERAARSSRDRAAFLRRLRKSTQQHLLSGGIERGVALLREALVLHGRPLATSPGRATLRALWSRARFWWRGPRFTPRAAAELDPIALERVETLWAGAMALLSVDHAYGDALVAQLTLDALELGEPVLTGLALSCEASAEALLVGARHEQRAMRLLDEAEAAVRHGGQEVDLAFVDGGRAVVHWSLGRWRECARLQGRALSTYTEARHGMAWRRCLAAMYAFSARAMMGEYRTLSVEVPEFYRDATDRSDRFARAIAVLGEPSIAWLVLDRAPWLLQEADAAIAAWPSDRFLTQHYHHLIARAQALLYLGRPYEAWSGLLDRWTAFERSFILSIPVIGAEMWALRGRAALATLRGGDDRPVAPRELRRVEADLPRAIRAIRKTRVNGSAVQADLLAAGEASLRAPAPQRFAAVAEAAEAADLRHLAAAAAWHAGAEARSRSEAWLDAQGVQQREALLGVLAP